MAPRGRRDHVGFPSPCLCSSMVDHIEVLPAPKVRNRRHELVGLAILAANFLLTGVFFSA